jgi:copper/silver efflux system protein
MEKLRIGHSREITEEARIKTIESSARTIGRAVFFSILITLISFAPILFLSGQEKKLFSPLVLTKTFCMIGSGIVTLFIMPMLMRVFIRGKLRPESRNPVSRFFIVLFSPIVRFCLRWKKTTLAVILVLTLGSMPVVLRTGTEFMPPLDEGSLLMMPVTLPDISYSEAKRILQVQDKILKSFPEVDNVLGKAGSANTATDNAPLSMIETFVILKPRSQWREGMTTPKLIAEMNEKVRIPGVSVGWTMPIINRINMLSTGIRTDVGVKVYGSNLDSIYALSREIQGVLQGIDGLADLYVEELTGGKYLEMKINRKELGRYGLDIDDVTMIMETALGGMNLTNTVEGRERFSVNLRLAQDFRNDVSELKRIPVQTEQFGTIPLSAVVDIQLTDGPPMINSENALLRGTVLFNVRGRDMGSVVKEAKQRVEARFKTLPQGYYVEWSGQYEHQVSAQKRLSMIIPIVLLIICFVLYFTFQSWREALIVLSGMPFALIGGILSLHFYDVNISVSVAVGLIALFGVAMETGVLILTYMNRSVGNLVAEKGERKETIQVDDIEQAVFGGAVLRIRPVLMTVTVDMLGLYPVLASTGPGSDVMIPLALPYVFGLITATLYALIVLPVIFALVKEWEFKRTGTLTYLTVND